MRAPRPLVVDAGALRAIRLARGMTQEQLAIKSGFTDKTIRALEGAKRDNVRASTIACIAQALGAPVESFAMQVASADLPASAATSTAKEGKPASLATPSSRPRLAELVAGERALGQRIARDAEGRAPLTAKAFQDVMTAFLAHDGARFHVVGVVDEQRGVSFTEAAALGGVCGVSARFRVRVVLATGALLGVTVHTRDAAETLAMQARVCDAAALHVRLIGHRAETAEAARLFAWFESTTTHPWTLLVERVLESEGDAGTS